MDSVPSGCRLVSQSNLWRRKPPSHCQGPVGRATSHPAPVGAGQCAQPEDGWGGAVSAGLGVREERPYWSKNGTLSRREPFLPMASVILTGRRRFGKWHFLFISVLGPVAFFVKGSWSVFQIVLLFTPPICISPTFKPPCVGAGR